MIKHDPVEETKEYKAIEKELEEKIKKELEGVRKGIGYCHIYWSKKREILLRDYGIRWSSPASLNPHVCFD